MPNSASPAVPTTGKPLHNVGWLVAERVLRGVLGVFVLGVLTRSLGPGGFGALNTALALAGTLMPIAHLGLDSFVVRDLVAAPELAGAVLGTAAWLRFGAGALSAAGLGLWAWRVGAPVAPAVLLPCALTLLWQAGDVVDVWFRRLVFSRPVVVTRLGVVAGGAVVKLVLAARGAGVVEFAWVYSLEALVFVLMLAVTYRRSDGAARAWSWDSERARRWLRQGWGFVAGAAIASLAFRFDQLAVAQLLGEVSAGFYFGAMRLLEVPLFLATALTTALLPAFAESAQSPGSESARLELNFEAAAAIAWIAAIGATVAGPWLVPLILGPAYAPATAVLIIYSWGNLALFTGLVRAQYLAIHPAPGTLFLQAVLTLIGQGAGSLWLIPRLGIAGGALAFASTQIAVGLVLPIWLPALRPCVAPQMRALLLPLRPGRWAHLWRALG